MKRILLIALLLLTSCSGIDSQGNIISGSSNTTGPQGAQGAQGAQGIQGIQGVKGDTGNVTVTVIAGSLPINTGNVSGLDSQLISMNATIAGKGTSNVTLPITTGNVTGLDAALAGKLPTANVTVTQTAGLVPAADANKTVDAWVSKIVYVKVVDATIGLITGTAQAYFTVPTLLNGMKLALANTSVYTVSSSGLPTFGIYDVTQSVNMLSTNITIDVNELTSYTAATPCVIANVTMATGDQIRLDCNVAGTGTNGWDMFLTFRNQ